MDLRVLRSFLAVCRHGNITRAAEAVCLSQPALTRQIQDLERELGCPLLARSTRKLELTEAGYLFQIRAQEILAIAEQTKRELSSAADSLRGIVRVGCVESSVMKWLSSMIKEFSARHPQVLFELYSADGDDLRAHIDENLLDFALLLEPVEVAKYRRIALPTTDRWVVAVRKDAVPEGKKALSYAEVAALPLIFPRRSIVRDEICGWLGAGAETVKVAAYHNLPSNALVLVQDGIGSLLCVEGQLAAQRVRGLRILPLDPPRLVRHVAVRKRNRALSRPCEAFWDAVQERCAPQAAED